MKWNKIALVAVVLLALGAIAFWAMSQGGAPSSPDPKSGWGEMTGKITEVSPGPNLRILVEGAPMSSGEASLVWVTVTNKTRIMRLEGGTERSTGTGDLKVGTQVKVKFDGPMLLSLPAQAGAETVTILN